MAPSKKPASAVGAKKKQASLFSFFGKAKAAAKKSTKEPKQTSEKKETPSTENPPSQKPAVIAPSQSSPVPPKKTKTVSQKALTSNKTAKKTPKTLKRKKSAPSKDQLRRRAVLEDTDEEEFLNDDDPSDLEESGSEFEAGGSEDESELEYDDDFDDEESEAPPPRKARRTSISSAPSTKTPLSSAKKTPPVRTAPSWSRRVTPSADSVGLDSVKKQMVPSSSLYTMDETATPLRGQQARGKPPAFVKGALNPGGSHLHNHLSFVQNPRDSRGRTPDDPDYDCRTLRVNKMEFKKVNGQAMTAAVEQWWDLRAEYNDCVLLFKTGKFYEMFHMDADVGVRVLGLIYMKGHVAHAGFPEISYGQFSSKLCRAGYKVARVEQTETPDMLKERNKGKKGKDAAKVVNREVCSILTLGTRTYSFMDDNKILEQAPDTIYGPLLCISERQLSTEETPDPTMVREYGVTLVDSTKGRVMLGQFLDDSLCTHLQTLLASYAPSEILYKGDGPKASDNRQSLKALFVSYRATSREPCRIEIIRDQEVFPRSTAVDRQIRQKMQRSNPVQPWDVNETLEELNRMDYFRDSIVVTQDDTQASHEQQEAKWPQFLREVLHYKNEHHLAISSFGGALFFLQRNLVDYELLSMGMIYAYACHTSTLHASSNPDGDSIQSPLQQTIPMSVEEDDDNETQATAEAKSRSLQSDAMTLDGNTLHNLEILANNADNKLAGSLWSRLYKTKTPHGSRMLLAWLLRPLSQKSDIDMRADAVEELASGAAQVPCEEARKVLSGCGDIERLLSRIHSMSVTASDDPHIMAAAHPNERAILYEEASYNERKIADFSKILHSLKEASAIPSIFEGLDLRSTMLQKIVRLHENGGCFPDCSDDIEWYFENFDLERASRGDFEPHRGVDQMFDDACDAVERIRADFKSYKNEVCQEFPQARSAWKYINTDPEKKDKYLIELPASVRVPSDFAMKGKRGNGAKQVNKYRTPVTEALVKDLENALEAMRARKAKGVQLIFKRFSDNRHVWQAVATATAMLDALAALAQVASLPGYTRPRILEYTDSPIMSFQQGRHPCVEGSAASPEFIPNDLKLGTAEDPERLLLLSGPNMGGKSTFLRQTCILAILAQIGSFVPAEYLEMTPVDKIYTRLGAQDRLLLGQSTFFVELSETATALRGATNRSIVIMDELGRGTSTFDGTAIASATVKYLVEKNKCLALFATHYHNLIEDWKNNPQVRLGHMECMVEADDESTGADRITFLYTLGKGACPKSFGINVARLAGLPNDVLIKAKRISKEFEEEMNAGSFRRRVEEAVEAKNWELVRSLWEQVQG